jgi:hypothetical protein
MVSQCYAKLRTSKTLSSSEVTGSWLAPYFSVLIKEKWSYGKLEAEKLKQPLFSSLPMMSLHELAALEMH